MDAGAHYPSARLRHAAAHMRVRGVSEFEVRAVLERPGKTEHVRPGRVVLTSLAITPESTQVLRVFVDVDRLPPVVVTVYKSSKIAKYWGQL